MNEDPLQQTGLFKGMQIDLKRRAPHYWNDWVEGWNLKTTAAILFIFFTSIGPAVTFAELLLTETEVIGVVEVLLSTAISGAIFSIIGGQPLVILGVTGPVSILTISIFNMTESLGINFLPFYAWAQIWAAIMHWALAATNSCNYIRYVTRFSCETFGVLIAIIYLDTGIRGIVKYFSDEDFGRALLELILATGVALLSSLLSGAKSWKILNGPAREIIADYGATISLVLWTGVSYIGRAEATSVPRVDVPDSFETTGDRNLFIDLTDIDGWAIAFAIVPGAIITILFIFDHNVSSLLAQDDDFNLKKGSAYHWDYFVLGICIFVTGLLGIPPCNGLIPQAPLHTKALAVTSVTKQNGVEVRQTDKVYEQRFTNLSQALLILLMCFFPFIKVLGFLPLSNLDGLFIFMGIASFDGNQFYDRLVLMMTESSLRISQHDFFGNVDFGVIKRFSIIQLAVCLVIYGITLTPAAMVFPVLIAALVAIRAFVFPRYFKQDDLQELDFIDPQHVYSGKDKANSERRIEEYAEMVLGKGGTDESDMDAESPESGSGSDAEAAMDNR